MIAMKLYRCGFWDKWDAFGGGEAQRIERYDMDRRRKRNAEAVRRDDEEIMELLTIVVPEISQ